MIQTATMNTHLPSSQELNEAIAAILQENEELDAPQVRHLLTQQHNNWRIPERRVCKFVKRQKRGNGSVWSSETDDCSTASATVSNGFSSAGGLVKTLGSSVKSAFGKVVALKSGYNEQRHEKPKEDAATIGSTISGTPPRSSSPPDHVTMTKGSKDDKMLSPMMPEEDVDVKYESLSEGARNLFADDNDQKKERGCQPCEGCVIL